MRIILSIIMGLMPDVLYFTLFLIYIKNLKEKRIKLFILIGISYFVCLLIQKWNFIYYMIFMLSIYFSLKVTYKKKTQIIDMFIVGLLYLYQVLLSAVLLLFLNDNIYNYYFLYILSRILLFLPLLFRNKFNNIYKKYCKFWNRNDKEKRPIKSITLRNISLILLNGLIFILNMTIINIINFYK